jgi:hypothetical protein
LNLIKYDNIQMAIQQILGCCEPTPPPPVDVNVLNCDGSTSAVTYSQAPMPVEIVQTKPFIICKSSVDFEIGCSSVDGRMLVRSFVQDEDGVITSQVFEQDGVTAVTDGSTLVNCSAKDIEDVESCFQDITDKSITYRQVVFVETATQTVVASIWLNSKGVAIDAPLNVEPCKEEKLEGSVAVKIDCETTSIENFSDTVKALIPHVVQVQEICKIDEIDFIHTNWLPICIGGVQWYVAEEYTFNNTTLIKRLVGKVYKQGANGAIGVAVPVGVIVEGSCSIVTQRRHENFVITGTTPLVIPAGAISISITKTNNTGFVNISGDNGINFPLTFNRENFTDSVNEEVSTLSAYTITGTSAGTTYKVHIIR